MTSTVLTIIVGLAGIVVGALASWWFSRARKPVLYVRATSSALLSASSPAITVNVATVNGAEEVENPHLVQASVTNTGRDELVEQAFDGRRPLTVDLGKAIVALIEKPLDTVVTYRADGTTIHLGPGLLRKNA